MRGWPWVLALGACGGGEGASDAAPANVVFVVVDTLRADHARSSDARASTPHLDALAADGVAFEHAFSHAPLTLPAHTALFSSRTPRETAVVNNGQAVPLDLPLLADDLAERGYACQAAVSLSTLWPVDEQRSLERGFAVYRHGRFDISRADETNASLGGMLERVSAQQPFFLFAHYSDPHEPYDSHGVEHKSAELLLDGATLERLTTSEWTAERLDLRLEPGEHTLEVRADHPFKLRRLRIVDAPVEIEVHFEQGGLGRPIEGARARIQVPPGAPVDCRLSLWVHDVPDPERLAERYRAEAEVADRAVGELLAELQRRGLYESSLIVFTSDHGEALGEHGIVGHVRTLYDELLHVPLVIKPPRGHQESRRLRAAKDVLARHIDVVPTVLELLGLPALPGQRGLSLLHTGERLLAAETHAPEAPHTLYGLRDLRWKMVCHADDGSFELYDLRSDPGELENVFERDGAMRGDWQTILREFARLGTAGELDPATLDPRTRSRLEGLGYF
jgi:arylsulfatase A-like enzyme